MTADELRCDAPHVELRSDNAAAVCPEVLRAIVDVNVGSALAYGEDDVTARLQHVVRDLFEHDRATVFPVTSGTAANALALSAMCPPWGAVLCHATAHVLNSECGATSMFGGGAIMRGVPGDGFRLQPDTLRAAFDAVRWDDPHHSQPKVLSLTQATDMGTAYSVAEVEALSAIARERGLRVHVDGARIANAIAAVECTPAEMTWRAGVDVLSLGATKNGALSAEGIVVFDEALAEELVYRTKRAGHVTSKMRFQSAQLIAYLTDDVWLRNAAVANQQMSRLVTGLGTLGFEFVAQPDVNMLFVDLDQQQQDRLARLGILFYAGRGWARFVTSWQTTDADIDTALTAFTQLSA